MKNFDSVMQRQRINFFANVSALVAFAGALIVSAATIL